MRRGMAFTVGLGLLGACGFTGGSGSAPDAGEIPDAAIDAAPDPGANGPLPATAFCPGDPAVMVCFEFENTTRDGSRNRLDAKGTGFTYDRGQLDRGLRLNATSNVNVVDSPVFDVSAITIQAWVFPTVLPAAPPARFGVIDVALQYGVFVYHNGLVSCSLGDLSLMSQVRISASRWTHITCTYDGATARLFLNGQSVLVLSDGHPMGRAGTLGMQIGSNSGDGTLDAFIGTIDQVRLMSVARTPDQVCRDAGRADCNPEGEQD